MAKSLRIEYPGVVYHVTSRGNARQAIFLSDADRQTFLNVLGSSVENTREKRFKNWDSFIYMLQTTENGCG